MKRKSVPFVPSGRDEMRWPPRVPQEKVRGLYKSQAAGLLDGELLDDVGITLWLRCEAILDVAEARAGRVKCPRCANREQTNYIQRTLANAQTEQPLRCPVCSWECTWGDYHESFRRKQLHMGSAGKAFETFYRRYPGLRAPTEKLIAIDRLIHEFHYSLRADPDRPTRAAGVNLISGRLTEVVAFLDDLAYAGELNPEMDATRADWARNVERFRAGFGHIPKVSRHEGTHREPGRARNERSGSK